MAEGVAERIKKRFIFERDVDGVGKVHIARLHAGELMEFSQLKSGQSETAAWLLQRCVVEASGAPVYGTPEDVWKTDPVVIEGLSSHVLEVNRLKAAAAGGDGGVGVKDAKKGLPAAPSSA